jgi:hypothetical protein
MEKPVSSADLNKLRIQKIISEYEVAFVTGDVLIAEHVVTKDRRVISAPGLVLESTRRLLKD